MKSLWNDAEARSFGTDPLQLRVYTSRLLGREEDLVLHGGGNTSVKASLRNPFGDTEDVLYVKGSGWDLATIEAAGFAPVRLEPLLRMVTLDSLTDAEMVRLQRTSLTDPAAPNPSVEAILHAFIPFKFVDHTHADAVVLITNTEDGERRIHEIYGDRVLIVPYVMPGFVLSRKVYELTRDIDWSSIEGMILLNHGVFTFSDDARESYERMIRIVTEAEAYLDANAPVAGASGRPASENLLARARLRRLVSSARGAPVVALADASSAAVDFSSMTNVADIATRGPLTPDHVIRTKPQPLIVADDLATSVDHYTGAYREYFERNTDGSLERLDSAPRWAVWPGNGTVTFGRSVIEARIVADIVRHTIPAILKAEGLRGWAPLGEREVFDVEYWELEQAKLRKRSGAPPLAGRIAVVTGAASGIGRACVDALAAEGACVAALDILSEVADTYDSPSIAGMPCDVTDAAAVHESIAETVRRFGGIDIVVSNAGIFPASEEIENLHDNAWDRSIATNLTSHERLLKTCIPYLCEGIDPAVVIIGSKNVPAPGPGAAAYSVAKAGLTQLARVAALELGGHGIRVNVVHPNNVFDTAIWTAEVLESRARHYGMSVEEYKRNNVLKTDVSSADVAAMVCAMAGPIFAKTTGAQVPVDGGNDRVI